MNPLTAIQLQFPPADRSVHNDGWVFERGNWEQIVNSPVFYHHIAKRFSVCSEALKTIPHRANMVCTVTHDFSAGKYKCIYDTRMVWWWPPDAIFHLRRAIRAALKELRR